MKDTYSLWCGVNDKSFSMVVMDNKNATIDNPLEIVEETLETKHTEQILFIIELLKGIIKETNHNNRDTMKLPKIIYDLEVIYRFNNKQPKLKLMGDE